MRNIFLAITLCASACAARFHTNLPVEDRLDVVTHYLHGESLDKIAAEFGLYDREEARAIVNDVMFALAQRFHRER